MLDLGIKEPERKRFPELGRRESQCKQAAYKGEVTFSGGDTANVRQPLEKKPKEQVLPYSISSWVSPLAKLTLQP